MKKKTLLPLVLSLTTLAMVSCGGNYGEEVEYTFSISAQNGMPLEDGGVKLYRGKKLVATGWSDESGVATVKAPKGEYTVKSQLPQGFHQVKEFKTDAETLEYDLAAVSSLIDAPIPEEYLYPHGAKDKEALGLYDVMYDMEFTTKQLEWSKNDKGKLVSKEVTQDFKFSDILKTKKAIVFNFWFINCQWCQVEFPYIQEAYTKYEDDIALLAFDYQDDIYDILEFQGNMGYTFNMIYDDYGLTNAFDVGGFPTTVIIDRYGMVSWIQGTFASARDVEVLFDQYTSDDYKPTWKGNQDEPDIPTYEWPSMEEIASVANGTTSDATFKKEENADAKYNWPWLISKEEGAIYPSNAGHHNSYSIMYVDVHLDKDEVFAFDYKSSSEKDGDILYVLLDGRIIKEISGVDTKYRLCELFVSNESRDYEFGFVYMKDEASIDGDDTVYVKNFSIYGVSEIKTPTYVLREASYGDLDMTSGKYTNYVNAILNEDDGYYHVDSKDGQLLLVGFFQTTHFDNRSTIYNDTASYKMIDPLSGEVINDALMRYITVASNTEDGYVPVTADLKELLESYIRVKEGKGHKDEWLELCVYYDNYGGAPQYTDPAAGLSTDNAFIATLGEENYATFKKVIMPRGLCFKFTAEESGVYHFYSLGDDPAVAWYSDENDHFFYESQFDEREIYWTVDNDVEPVPNFHDYIYLDADQSIFVRVGFEDIYLFDTLQFGIEFTNEQSRDVLKLCSPGYYTSEFDENGEATGLTISTGIETAVGEDGYYHEKLKDGSLGSIVYCDFMYPTTILEFSLYEILTNSKIKDAWGGKPLDFTNIEEDNGPIPDTYKKDLTNDFKAYISKIDGSSKPHNGCVPVDEKLHDMLQMVSGKYGFYCEKGWQKLCYYYDHIGK